MSAENKVLCRRWFEEVWNKGREAAIDELLAADGLAYGLGERGQALRGPEPFKGFYRVFRGAFPDLHLTIDDMLAEGDKVLVRFSGTGTHQGDHLGVPATRRPVTFTGMTLVRCQDGKLVEGWNNFDLYGLLTQVGAVPLVKVPV